MSPCTPVSVPAKIIWKSLKISHAIRVTTFLAQLVNLEVHIVRKNIYSMYKLNLSIYSTITAYIIVAMVTTFRQQPGSTYHPDKHMCQI